MTDALDTPLLPITVLLVDDQAIVAEAVRRMLIDQQDIVVHYCSDPTKAIQTAEEIHPTVILQDLVMPDVEGLMLVRYFRANSLTRDIPLIVLSAKEEPTIKAEAFALGANDYMVKLPDRVELIARIRYHSLAYIRLLERNQAYKKLEESQRALNAELAEAAAYVRSLLPKPVDGDIKTSWRFIPSTQLGGDAFGYHWIDPDNFAFYLLDVCGHGVGAALLSISVMNVLRSQSLMHIDFLHPDRVLAALNASFPMEEHNNMFFTIWYGVYNKKSRQISYSSGGHPPAILIDPEAKDRKSVKELRTAGTVIGAIESAHYESAQCHVSIGSRLYVYSDGIYELPKSDGTILELEDFISVIARPSEQGKEEIDRILGFSQSLMGCESFADDVSILEIAF